MAKDQTPTPEQLREDAAKYSQWSREASFYGDEDSARRSARAALALEEQAARLEVPECEILSWRVADGAPVQEDERDA